VDIFEQATGGTRSAQAACRKPAPTAAPEIDR
jgi:hypothetical protein